MKGPSRSTLGMGRIRLRFKGVTLAAPPKTLQETIAAWSALCKDNCNALPHRSDLCKWYFNREAFTLSEEQRLTTAYFCLSSEVPWFFWIKECKSQTIKKMIDKAIRSGGSNDLMFNVLCLSVFLGKSTYTRFVRGLGDRATRLGKYSTRFPSSGPRSLFSPQRLEAMRGTGRIACQTMHSASLL